MCAYAQLFRETRVALMVHSQQTLGVYNPIRLLAVACAVTVAVSASLGWNIYDSHRIANLANQRNYRIEVLRGRILHLDEVLTMSARMEAATGDQRWEERYRTFEPQLDAAIREAMTIAPEVYSGEAASVTNGANIALVEMENRAFDLVRQGRSEAAKLILFSDEYEEQKRIYAHGMAELEADLNRIAVAELRSRERGTVWLIAAVVLVLLTTAAGWLVILRILRKWQARLVESNRHLIAQGEDLAELNATLDQRVENQTRDLREARDYTDNIIGSMIDMLLVVAPEGGIVKVNEATCSLLGYREEELIGQPASILFYEEDDITRGFLSQDSMSQKPSPRRTLARERAVRNTEKLLRAKNGDRIRVLMSSSVMQGKDGQIRGIVCIAQDITERKQKEKELRKSLDELERFSRLVTGRELRMIKLKDEVNALCIEIGKQPTYRIDFREAELGLDYYEDHTSLVLRRTQKKEIVDDEDSDY